MKRKTPVFFLLLLSVLGCNLSEPTSSESPINASSRETKKAGVDPKAGIADAHRKFREAPFVTVRSESAGETPASLIEQYSAADKSFSRKNISGDATEVIIIGDESFSKMNSAWPWRKDSGSASTASETFFFPHDRLSRMLPEFNVTSDAEETINGKTAYAFTLEYPKPIPDAPNSVKIWIDKETGHLRKLTMGNGRTDVFDFETPVKIERPALEKP